MDRIVENWIIALRNGKYRADEMTAHVDDWAMEILRAKLGPSDTDALLQLMRDLFAPTLARNIAASVLLGKRLLPARHQAPAIAQVMREYYWEHSDQDARSHDRNSFWSVSRAIARALSSTNNSDDCLLDWIEKLRHDRILLEKNLEMSDDYHNGPETVVRRFGDSMRDYREKYPTAQVWPIFYLGHRAEPGDPRVVKVLEECRDQTRHDPLRALCDEALSRLRQ